MLAHQDIQLANGRVLRVGTTGGTGPPLVLLHGLLDSGEGWAGVLEATRRPGVAIDLPGFGGSDLPARARIGGYADAVVEALERLDIGDCVMVGHSLGGAVATAVMERARSRVNAALLLAPAGYGRISMAELFARPGVREVSALALSGLLRSRMAVGTAYSALVANGVQADPALLHRLSTRAVAGAAGTRAALIALDASGRSRGAFHRRTISFDGPVTALWGSDDQLVPLDHAHHLQRSIPHAEVEIWYRMGHHPQVEQPKRLVELMEQTVQRGRDEQARRAARR
ncbi:MAG: alpha/beta fold hydrolase, partial [Solirubrobacterales bacterium]